MGEDIHIKIIKRNKDTNNWEEILLFNKDNEKIPIYQERNYNMFDILKDLSISSSIVNKNLPETLQQEIKEAEGYHFSEVNLADLKLYLYNHQKVEDFYSDNEELIDNPIKNLIERIEYYIFFAMSDTLYYVPSDIMILYWFDH